MKSKEGRRRRREEQISLDLATEISEILYISIVGLATITLYLPSIACKKKGLVLIHKPKEGSLDMVNLFKM